MEGAGQLGKKPLERDLGSEWRLASHGWVAFQAEEEACMSASVAGTRCEEEAREVSAPYMGLFRPPQRFGSCCEYQGGGSNMLIFVFGKVPLAALLRAWREILEKALALSN